jgi:hypothetical protein
MASDGPDDENDPLGPARPLLSAAVRLGARAADAGDHAGCYALCACAARLARKVRGLGEVADFRLERALEEADGEDDPAAQAGALRAGLESVLGGDETGDEPAPPDPLAAAQQFIGTAISIGAPAYNTGDRQGCFDVYACTARMILATVPDLGAEPAAKLREGLEQCAKLDDPDAQAWAMRHAFDAVAEMGAGAEAVARGEVRALLARAISIGAPAFNLGDHRGCYEVYACTARLLANSAAVPDAEKQALREALSRASAVLSVTRQAWIMREAFDVILGSSDPAPGPDG